MKTITFYSYKGGAGRSLALANAARYLARWEFSVVAMDFDLEAPGLQYKFPTGPKSEPLPVGLGVVDYLHGFLADGQLPASLKEFVVEVRVPGADKGRLQLIPAGRVPSREYWSRLCKINWHELLYSGGAKGVQVFLDLKNRIADELKPDFLLIDSRTGITEMGGVATALLADKVICLVLPSPENLEGARAVLRSLKRSRRELGLEPVEITVALSRLPEMKEPDGERKTAERIRASLNEEAEDLQDTLTCSEVYVLHSEPALEVHEELRVGRGVSPDESVLLRDYLRLFAGVLPKELVESKLGTLLNQAQEKIWRDPDGAMKDLEELAESFGRPETYRALLRCYEIRNISSPVVFEKARRLWELTNDATDPQLWLALRRSFWTEPRSERKREPDLDFMESVWREAGKRDAEFGVKLAEEYGFPRALRAAHVLLEVIGHSEPSARLVGRCAALAALCISELDSTGKAADAERLIREFRKKLGDKSKFIESWASHALRQQSKEAIMELAEPARLESVKRTSLALASRLLVAAGRQKEATPLADEALRDALERGAMDGIEELAKLFRELGRWQEFAAKVQGRVPISIFEEIRPPTMY